MLNYLKKIPKIDRFLYVLIAYSILVISFNLSQIFNLIFHATTFVISYFLINIIYEKILKFKQLNPITMYISLLIFFLIIHPLEISIESAVVNFLLVVFLFIFKTPRILHRPILNPVVGSSIITGTILFLSSFIFSNDVLFVSWWGANFGGIFGFITLILITIYVAIQYKKIALIIAFLITQLILVLIFSSLSIYTITLFLLSVMLAEIKTSPSFKHKEQVLFGILGAVLIMFTPSIFEIDHQLLGIGVFNALYIIYLKTEHLFPKPIQKLMTD